MLILTYAEKLRATFPPSAADELEVVAVEVLPLTLPPAIWKAKTPPNGPAGFARDICQLADFLGVFLFENPQFATFSKQTFDCPPTVPEQVVPAGIATLKGW
jgi:hypothetical protein